MTDMIGPYPIDSVQCSDALDFLRALPDGCVNMHLTSPPYDNLRKYKGFTWDFEGIAHESYRTLKPGGVMVWIVSDMSNNGSETLNSFRQAIHFIDNVGYLMHDTMIWEKDGVTFPDINRYYQTFEYMFVLSKGKPKTTNLLQKVNVNFGQSVFSRFRVDNETLSFNEHAETRVVSQNGIMGNVWKFGRGFNKSTRDQIAFEHPAIFPEKLAERHILSWTNSNDLVCDFFMGSGTTAKMARLNGRHYLGCDISSEYVALAQKRLAQPYTPPLFSW